MSHETYTNIGRGYLAIPQLVLFLITSVFAAHSLYARRIGWFGLGLFSLARVIGAALIIPIAFDSDNVHTVIAAHVFETLGVFFLPLMPLGFLRQARKHVPGLHQRVFLGLYLINWAAFLLYVAGVAVAVSRSANGPITPTLVTQAAHGILVGVSFITFVVAMRLRKLWKRKYVRRGRRRARRDVVEDPEYCEDEVTKEKSRLLYTRSIVCLIIIYVRLVPALLTSFGELGLYFGPVEGFWLFYLFLSFLPELWLVSQCMALIRGVSHLGQEGTLPPREETSGRAASVQDNEMSDPPPAYDLDQEPPPRYEEGVQGINELEVEGGDGRNNRS